MEETTNDISVILRRLVAGCIDWPLAFIIGFAASRLLKGPAFLMPFYLVLFVCFYFAFFECCPLQATPGKLLTRLKVSNFNDEYISIWQAVVPRLWQCVVIIILFYTGFLVDSLGLLMNWDATNESIILCVLFGLFGLTGWIVWRLRDAHPPMNRACDRVVSKHFKDNNIGKNKLLSCEKFLTLDLSTKQVVLASLAILATLLLPYLSLSLDYNVYSKQGILKKGSVLYAVKDVPEGSIIRADDLEIREMEERRIPGDVLDSTDKAVGHFCKYGLSAGQIVSIHDVSPLKESEKRIPDFIENPIIGNLYYFPQDQRMANNKSSNTVFHLRSEQKLSFIL